MSEPQTIKAYLVALNAALEVGLRNRRRILSEVADHLCQAAQEHLRRGADPREAQQLAIVAFGSPEQVAARFEAGLVGALDRRLALSARWVHHWLTQHRLGVPACIVVVSLLFAAAFGAIGAAFGKDPLVAAGACLSGGLWTLWFFMLSRSYRQSLRQSTQTAYLPSFLVPAVGSCLVLLGGEYSVAVQWPVGLTLVFATMAVLHSLIERAIKRAAQGYPHRTEDDRRQAWSADHPWHSAVAVTAPLPLGLVALVAVHPGPVALRVALVALVAAMAALAAVAVRLEAARRERDAYRRQFISEPT